MKKSTYLLITIFVMHFITIINITIFNGQWNGFVLAINTLLLIFAVGLVLPLGRGPANSSSANE